MIIKNSNQNYQGFQFSVSVIEGYGYFCIIWCFEQKISRAYICKTVEKRDEIMKIVGWIGLSSRFGIRARGQTCTPALRHHFTSNTDSKMHTTFFNCLALEVFDTIYSLLVHTTCLFSKVHLENFFWLEICEEYIQTKNREAKKPQHTIFFKYSTCFMINLKVKMWKKRKKNCACASFRKRC